MGALLSTVGERLVERWLGGATPLPILDEASVAIARDAARAAGASAGLDDTGRERLAFAVSELAHNQRKHARNGLVALRAVARAGVPGVEIIAADRGAGISDPTRAVDGAPSFGQRGLGVGLSAVLRQTDEVDADVRWGEGTCLRARVFAAPVARSEVAILGRAGPDDPVSGDDASVIRTETGLVAAVVDGLGHGPAARDAAMSALAVLHEAGPLPVADVLARCDTSLVGSRGAVIALAHIDLGARSLHHAAVGNITTRIHGADGAPRPLLSTAGTLGVTRPWRRPHAQVEPFATPQLLTMVSDGIVTRVDFAALGPRLRHHPLVVAHQVLTGFARANDDAMILVVR